MGTPRPGGACSKEWREAKEFIKNSTWIFAKTMPQWPHWYVLGRTNVGGFNALMNLISEHGYEEKWGRRTDKYLVIDGWKYWGFDLPTPLINRAKPLSNEQVRKNAMKYRPRPDDSEAKKKKTRNLK